MLEKILLILILAFQAIFSGLIFLNKETSFNWQVLFSFLQFIVVICGFFVGYFLLKKEIIFNKKLEVHEKITSMLVDRLHKSFYALSPFIRNSFFLEKSNPKDNDDFPTKNLRESSKELLGKISDFQSDFQSFYELLQFWKPLFSENTDRELKFLFDMHCIFTDDLWEYKMKLGEYSMLSLMKNDPDIEKEKKELISLEEKLSKKSTVFINGLGRLVSDMSKEVFGDLFLRGKCTEDRLFNLELENSDDGDSGIFLTERGFEYKSYKKTAFQKEFGGFKERRDALRKFIEQDGESIDNIA